MRTKSIVGFRDYYSVDVPDNGDVIASADAPVFIDITDGAVMLAFEHEHGITGNIYGYLYNWWVTQEQISSDAVWTVPTLVEWTAFTNYLIATDPAITTLNIGNHLKSTRVAPTPHPRWEFHPTEIPLDTFNFGILPAGSRGVDGVFYFIGIYASLWLSAESSPSDGQSFYMTALSGNIDQLGQYKEIGSSLRLVRPATAWEIANLVNGDAADNYYGNDGKPYRTVFINNQVWTAENLAETKYRDGSSVAKVTDASDWVTLTTAAYCAYDNDDNNAFIIR